jgi:hypothetical protein
LALHIDSGFEKDAGCGGRSLLRNVREGRICAELFSAHSYSEVFGYMTANWAAAVVNVLILAFFAVVAIGVGLGAYAATELKRAEELRRSQQGS